MGSLDPNYRESAGNQSAMQVHIGDYVLEGKSANVMHDLHQMHEAQDRAHRRRLQGVPQPDAGYAQHPADRVSGQFLSDMFNELFQFHEMNHEVGTQAPLLA